jgi:hypothetical protein
MKRLIKNLLSMFHSPVDSYAAIRVQPELVPDPEDMGTAQAAEAADDKRCTACGYDRFRTRTKLNGIRLTVACRRCSRVHMLKAAA